MTDDHADDGRRHFASDAAVRRLEHEEHALVPLVDEAITALVAAVGRRPVRRVLDLGCGPGGALAALATAFPGATVVAADGSSAMLARAAERAAAAGVAARVQTLQADLDGDLAMLGGCQVVWAAMSLHHARDALSALRGLRTALGPDGVLCLVERPGGDGDTGHHGHPEVGPQMLESAGFVVAVDRILRTPAAERRLLIATIGG